MSAYIHVTLRVRWDSESVERYNECMEMLRFGIEDEARAFLENEDYAEATIESCEATG